MFASGQKGENLTCCLGRNYSYFQSWGMIIGSLVGSLLMLVGIGLLAYFCCRRRRSKQSQTVADDVSSPPPPNFVTTGGGAPPLAPRVPAYPVSSSDIYVFVFILLLELRLQFYWSNLQSLASPRFEEDTMNFRF